MLPGRRKEEALARLGRVQLLFGPESDTAKAGYAAAGEIRNAIGVLYDANPLEETDVEAVEKNLKDAAGHYIDFNKRARRAIKRARWRD